MALLTRTLVASRHSCSRLRRFPSLLQVDLAARTASPAVQMQLQLSKAQVDSDANDEVCSTFVDVGSQRACSVTELDTVVSAGRSEDRLVLKLSFKFRGCAGVNG